MTTKGSLATVAGHSSVPWSTRGSPGAAAAVPAESPRMARATRERFMTRSSVGSRRQNRCQQLGLRPMLLPPPPPLGQPAAQLGLEPALGGPVVLAAAKRFRQVLLLDARPGRVVGVLVALAVAEILHEPGRRVAD